MSAGRAIFREIAGHLACSLPAFADDDSFSLHTDLFGMWDFGDIPGRDALSIYAAGGLRDLAFTSNGWVATNGQTYMTNGNDVPLAMVAALHEAQEADRSIQVTSIERDRWLVAAENWVATKWRSDFSTLDDDTLDWQTRAKSIDHAVLSPSNGYALYSNEVMLTTDSVWSAIEYGLAGGQTLWGRMNGTVPGISIAIIREGRLAGLRTYGSKTQGGEDYVSVDTPFLYASMSKYLAGAAAMRLVDDGQIALDDDLASHRAEYPWGEVDGWLIAAAVDANVAPFRTQDVQLNHLLGHTGGIHTDAMDTSTAGQNGYMYDHPGDWGARYWLLGMDDGFEFQGPVWGGDSAPGTQFSYSNAGFLVAQGMLEDASGERMSDLLEDEVFAPLGMRDAFTATPLAQSDKDRLAKPHDDATGLTNTRFDVAWLAAYGVGGTAESYAQALIPLLNNGRDQYGRVYLSPGAVGTMLTNNSPAGATAYSSGLYVNTVDGSFSHTGTLREGYHNRMWGIPSRGDAIVILGNRGKQGTSNPQFRLMSDIRAAFQTATTPPPPVVFTWP